MTGHCRAGSASERTTTAVRGACSCSRRRARRARGRVLDAAARALRGVLASTRRSSRGPGDRGRSVRTPARHDVRAPGDSVGSCSRVVHVGRRLDVAAAPSARERGNGRGIPADMLVATASAGRARPARAAFGRPSFALSNQRHLPRGWCDRGDARVVAGAVRPLLPDRAPVGERLARLVSIADPIPRQPRRSGAERSATVVSTVFVLFEQRAVSAALVLIVGCSSGGCADADAGPPVAGATLAANGARSCATRRSLSRVALRHTCRRACDHHRADPA